jgi:thiol-disulfide isomerase/thioredoxin
VAAKIDFAAKRLAGLREIKGDDPEFDYGLERIKVAARLKSRYDYGWGTVSDLVLREVDAYLTGTPNSAGADEANCLAGFALSQKYAKDDAMRSRGFEQAETYLAKVAEDSEWYGSAQALSITNKIQTPGSDNSELGKQLAGVIEANPGDRQIYTTVSTRFSNSGAQYLWPIALGMQDLDDKKVTLEEYEGKVLLIDFWATWCPPCRAELPNLVKVYDTYHKQGFEIVSVSLDYAQSTTPEAYRQWIDSAGMNWRHAYDGDGWDTESIKRYFVSSIPAPFLVGTDGSLIAWGEDCRGDKLESTIQAALAKSSL